MTKLVMRRIAGPVLATLLIAAPKLEAQTARLRVELEGLRGGAAANVRAAAGIFGAARGGRLPTSQIERLHARAPEQIELALRPFGFYRPSVRSELRTDGRTWVARYVVDAGPPLLLSRVDVAVSGEGEDDAELLAAVRSFPLAAGDTLRHSLYEVGKRSLAGIAAERGYLDAVFDTSEIRIDLEAYRAEIALHLATGAQYLFGPVSFNQDLVDRRLLEGYLSFQPGDTFALSKLLETQRNLSSSPYFSQVEVRPDTAVEGWQVPIEIDFLPRKRQRYEFGLGYGTDTGFRGLIEADFRRLNRRGHNATVRLEVAQIRRVLAIQYRFPPTFPQTATYALLIGLGDFSPTWSTSLVGSLGVRRSQARGPLHETLSLSYELQKFTIAEQDGNARLLTPGATWTWTKAEDRVRPQNGLRLQGGAFASLKELLSSTTYLQLITSGRFIRGLGSRLRLLGRAKAGWTYWTDFSQLPPSVRFVSGGDNSVRGYSYESLGPRDEEGRLLGGDILVEASLEVDYAIKNQWALALFGDAGNGLDSLGDLHLAHGAGVGVRWFSPVGPVRLDLAYGFDEPSKEVHVHFTMGPDI
ncbi:MAG: outer membrane protein assembly factor [Gemmatimonadota bacterium]|nr:MAG: outer membrane protein assembly factor [Gemmatimonadota bacterium]